MEELRDKNGLTEQEFLAQYHPGDYPRPSMTVDMLIFAAPGLASSCKTDKGILYAPEHFLTDGTLKLLMVQRGGHPCLGCFALPGGFVGPDETVMHAAKRELQEETHVDGVPLRQLYTFSKPGRDPRTWVMSCAHLAVLDTDSIPVQAGDDADKAEWFTVTLNERDKNLYELQLTGETLTLSASLRCPLVFDEESCSADSSKGLAFDHASMILCGLKELFHI